MSNPFLLANNIDKYLKFMELIKTASPLTVKHYLIDLKQAFKYDLKSSFPRIIEEKELLATAKSAFNQWSNLSLASRNRKAATLKSFFSWAFDQGLTEQDLSLQITCPKVPRKIPNFLSVDEALCVLKICSTADEVLIDKMLFLLLYGGGLRISEACNLRWSDVYFSQKILRVKGKGSKERVIALPSVTVMALKSWQKSQGSLDFVFGDSPLNPRTAYEMIRKLGIQAGLLKPLHPHALRHSFATHLLTSGANLRILQELLGHESLQATEKYTHLDIHHLARTMQNLHPLGKRRA